ncbi:hypothetical protein ISCGN_027335 [Ixodes scapularis]
MQNIDQDLYSVRDRVLYMNGLPIPLNLNNQTYIISGFTPQGTPDCRQAAARKLFLFFFFFFFTNNLQRLTSISTNSPCTAADPPITSASRRRHPPQWLDA